jgi:hypothetical protein
MAAERVDLSELLAPLVAEGHDISGGIAPQPHHHGGTPGESVSVRVVEHGGHRIRIETTYRVFIDDQLFPDEIHVSNDGTVHYHGLPQYSVPSAVELGKLIVDRMSVGEVPPLVGEDGRGGQGGHDHEPDGGEDHDDHDHGHGGHGHGHGHGQAGER